MSSNNPPLVLCFDDDVKGNFFYFFTLLLLLLFYTLGESLTCMYVFKDMYIRVNTPVSAPDQGTGKKIWRCSLGAVLRQPNAPSVSH